VRLLSRYKRLGFPVCNANHWFLVVLNVALEQLQLYNSKDNYLMEDARSDLVGYVADHFGALRDLKQMRTVQQIGDTDCGVYTLKNMNLLS